MVSPDKNQIVSDVRSKYEEILKLHLEGRIFKEDLIKSWLDNILNDAKDYFINKYPDYDIFLFTQLIPKSITYRSNSSKIAVDKTDEESFAEYSADTFYCILRFFFFKHFDLNYNIEQSEDEVVRKGDEIIRKFLEGREYTPENANKYNRDITYEYANFIAKKIKNPRMLTINKIYKKPIDGKYFYKYLCHGKNIYSKIIQTYENEYLQCVLFAFFFK